MLEPLYAYLLIAATQYGDLSRAGYYNVGPNEDDCYATGKLADIFVNAWGKGARWVSKEDGGPHEAGFLKLDCSRIKHAFGWRPRWNLKTAVEKTVEWEKCRLSGGDVRACMDRQISEFFS